MKFDTAIVIKNYDGKDVLTTDYDTEGNSIAIPLTLRKTIIDAINNQLEGEVVTAEQKTKTFGLSVKLYENREVQLTADDITFIKERVGKVWNAVVYGRICELFDNPPAPEATVAN